MKKIIVTMLMFCSSLLHGQFVNFIDSSKANRFLGDATSRCSTKTDINPASYQKGFACENESVSSVLSLNFLDQQNIGKQFYIFNNFMQWIAENQSNENVIKAQANPQTIFSGSGVFSIIIGTSSYLQQVVTQLNSSLSKSCPAGQTMVAAQLKYNDGNFIVCWSQDTICLAKTDSFEILVSSDQDTTMPAANKVAEIKTAQGINLKLDSGPFANYAQATKSPRKIRLVKK